MHVEIERHPHGLGGGQLISGSSQLAVSGIFRYRPITATVVDLKFNSEISGSFGLNTISAGTDIFGPITQISQSSGVAMIYDALQSAPKYNI